MNADKAAAIEFRVGALNGCRGKRTLPPSRVQDCVDDVGVDHMPEGAQRLLFLLFLYGGRGRRLSADQNL